MNKPQRKSFFGGAGLGVTAVFAMVLCCAAPALVAGGLLASLGAVVRSPVVIALGLAVVGGAVAFAIRRRRSACCPPGQGQAATPDVANPGARPPH
ncbi:MAG: hypothetical protein ABR540_22390 [Acidimicrobiales bacterium]